MTTTSTPKQKQEIILDTGVKGLFLIKNFLTEAEEAQLLAEIDKLTWKDNRSKTRRVQMYGPWHNEKYEILPGCQISPLPAFSKGLTDKIISLCKENFPQFDMKTYRLAEDAHCELFINEYKQEDSLQFHMDHRSTYQEIIFGVSLLADVTMSYQLASKELKVKVPRRSLYLMTGDSRFKWKHGMNPHSVEGDRRVSLTYRAVNYDKQK